MASGWGEEWRLQGEDADEHFGIGGGGGEEGVPVGQGTHREIVRQGLTMTLLWGKGANPYPSKTEGRAPGCA